MSHLGEDEMGIPARAVTDANGLQSKFGGMFLSELRVQKTKNDPEGAREQDVPTPEKGTLELFVAHPRYSMLATHLIHVDGYAPGTRVCAGHTGRIVAMVVTETNRAYRACGRKVVSC